MFKVNLRVDFDLSLCFFRGLGIFLTELDKPEKLDRFPVSTDDALNFEQKRFFI